MTTTSSQILHHTTIFISEILSQSELCLYLFSVLRRKIPPFDQNTVSLTAESLENAISTTTPAIRSSCLCLSEQLLFSNLENPVSFFLSLIYSLCDQPINAALSLLHIFQTDPSLARSKIAPVLFEELFLVHLLPVLQWFNEQRSTILSSSTSSSGYSNEVSLFDDDQSVVLPCTKVLSKISEGQALELKELESNFEDVLDENCRHYKKSELCRRFSNRWKLVCWWQK